MSKTTVKTPKVTKPTDKHEKIIDLSNWKDLFECVKTTPSVQKINEYFSAHLKKLIQNANLDYQVQFLYDDDSISEWTQNRLYDSFSKLDPSKNTLLIIDSRGGSIESAYFISKAAKKFSKRFIVAIPRKAKSAATLISLGADEIHMGIVSQLGPIDPQINGLPALGVSNAVENIARICQRNPGASEMFARYLAITVEPATFGYFERITESAVQYAQRLLSDKQLPEQSDKIPVWYRLVYEYKDHSFVIDYDEALKILGKDIVKTHSKELELAEEIYKFLDDAKLLVSFLRNHRISLVGNVNDGFQSTEIKK